jgi:general secretion pathway protein A
MLGQLELLPRIKQMKNLWDRISLKYVINPLDEDETGEMIRYRLKTAGYISNVELFTKDAVSEVYQYTQGYPRKISMLCHNALASLVMDNKTIVNGSLVRDLISKEARIGV